MSMLPAAEGRHRADINLTPMIDVLLVLIVIFMTIAPVTPRGLNALLPWPAPGYYWEGSSGYIVVTVKGGGTVSLNREAMPVADLPGRLLRVSVNRPHDALFVRGEKGLEYRQVAEVIDIARGVGVGRVALMTY